MRYRTSLNTQCSKTQGAVMDALILTAGLYVLVHVYGAVVRIPLG